jgi:hypothetical protein
MNFSNPSLDAKYRRLGFKPTELGLELQIGKVHLSAAEHPWKGLVIIFTCITPRTMSQFDGTIPIDCSAEQIAGLIHVNIVTNFRQYTDDCRRHFQTLNIPLFQ